MQLPHFPIAAAPAMRPSAQPPATFNAYADADASAAQDRESEAPPQYRFSSSMSDDSVSRRGDGTLLLRDVEPIIPTASTRIERKRDYKGRRRVWPGVLLALVLIGAGCVLMAYFGWQAYDARQVRAKLYEKANFDSTQISGGADSSSDGDIVSDDGQIGNPKKYPVSTCELPNYQSKNGQLIAVAANGTEVPFTIKGINWFGMETGMAVPFGMWANSENGTTAYQIATFLQKNKFNAVRLPLMIKSILANTVPNVDLVNQAENRAINVTNYMSLLKSIVKVLQYRHIGVLLSMHTLTSTENGKLWYNNEISEEDFLKSVDILTSNLCSSEYYNIMGIDAKNEPWGSTWGDGGAADFRLGATKIVNRMLKGCPSWLGFVEGVNAMHTITLDDKAYSYYDWYGGGLQNARTHGIELSIANKLVWAPHYYTPAVYPQPYMYAGGTASAAGMANYIELDDTKLRSRIKATMDDMFGFLRSDTGPALLLGEFGGLYATDRHPKKTTKRCTDFTIEVVEQDRYAGAFVWSLNPESAYEYNPVDTVGFFTEGVLLSDWLSANTEFLAGLAKLDTLPHLQRWPCFAQDAA